MKALFIDDDGRFTYVRGAPDLYHEYDLGHPRPGKYVFAQRPLPGGQVELRQPCAGGGWQGNTISWPHGKCLRFEDAKNRQGRAIKVPVYEELPDAETLKGLAQDLGARVFKSRAAFNTYLSRLGADA